MCQVTPLLHRASGRNDTAQACARLPRVFPETFRSTLARYPGPEDRFAEDEMEFFNLAAFART
jgi:hypothetical protein